MTYTIESDQVTVICEGGWKYDGKVIKTLHSPFGNLLWIKLRVGKKTVTLNSKYIVAITSLRGL